MICSPGTSHPDRASVTQNEHTQPHATQPDTHMPGPRAHRNTHPLSEGEEHRRRTSHNYPRTGSHEYTCPTHTVDPPTHNIHKPHNSGTQLTHTDPWHGHAVHPQIPCLSPTNPRLGHMKTNTPQARSPVRRPVKQAHGSHRNTCANLPGDSRNR